MSARSKAISKRTPPVQENAVHDTADATDQKCHEQHYRHGNVIQFRGNLGAVDIPRAHLLPTRLVVRCDQSSLSFLPVFVVAYFKTRSEPSVFVIVKGVL
jgi:hypothetical protein